MTARPLVSVVIPAYDAAGTVDATLRSVRRQSHEALEILVVDDGSRDATCAIVERHAAEDKRIRLIRQANAGVAAARNTGIAAATAEFVAFVDADDLWHSQKIEVQVSVLETCGPEVGLVYTWYALIDAVDRVLSLDHRPRDEGDVVRRMCLGNVVGNGSSALVRRTALERIGGFEPELRRQKAQGCEDLLFYYRMATRYEFRVVPAHLTGYRLLPQNMSSDLFQMRRSYDLVEAEMLRGFPEFADEIARGSDHFSAYLVVRALGTGRASLVPRLTAGLAPPRLMRVTRFALRDQVPERFTVKQWIKKAIGRPWSRWDPGPDFGVAS